MAVAPLFLASMTELRSMLRMTGSAQDDAQKIIDTQVEQVRVNLYDRIGASRIAEITAITYTENATDEDGLLRARARAVELAWIKALLLRNLSMMFLDASGDMREAWNEEGFARHADRSELEKEIARLMAEVEAGLAAIGTGDPNDGSQVRATSIEPCVRPLKIGQVIGLPCVPRPTRRCC